MLKIRLPLLAWLAIICLHAIAPALQTSHAAASQTLPPAQTCAAFTQPLTWQKVEPDGARPPARSDAALVYDQDHGQLLLFGGRGGAGVLDDTWSFDLAVRRWQPIGGDGPRPPARFSMVAGIDQPRQRLLITSGQAGSGEFLDDVWSLDLTINTWSQVTTQGGPPPARYGSAGGAGGGALYLSHGFTGQGRFDDTWAFDPATHAWANVTPAGAAPLKRCLHSGAALDADTLVIFGGCASGFGPCPLGDTWRFDRQTGAWTELRSQASPPARLFAAMTPIGGCGSLLLFGGQGQGDLDDLWRLDVASGTWTRIQPAGAPPAPRHGHGMVWVDGFGGSAGAALVFGGQGAGASLDDLWALLPTAGGTR